MENWICNHCLRKKAYLILGALLLSIFCWMQSDNLAAAKKEGNATKITAKEVSYSRKENKIRFIKDVHVLRQDFQLWCDQITVFLAAGLKDSMFDGKNKQARGREDNIEKIVAQGNVRLKYSDREAYGDEAIYDARERLITLKGDVRLLEDENQITGDILKYYLQEKRSEIAGNVTVRFYSNQTIGIEDE